MYEGMRVVCTTTLENTSLKQTSKRPKDEQMAFLPFPKTLKLKKMNYRRRVFRGDAFNFNGG